MKIIKTLRENIGTTILCGAILIGIPLAASTASTSEVTPPAQQLIIPVQGGGSSGSGGTMSMSGSGGAFNED